MRAAKIPAPSRECLAADTFAARMAGLLLRSDFWYILGFNLLALWPAVLLLGKGAAAFSKRAQGLAIQATAGTLLLCLLSALALGCFKTVLWGVLPVLWLVFQTGKEGPKLPRTQWAWLTDWLQGAGVLAVWTLLASVYLRFWTDAPYSLYPDTFFYARTAFGLGQTGVETSMQELLRFMPTTPSGPTPYHYAELWLAAGLNRLTHISTAAWLEFGVWPLLLSLAALWLSELLGRKIKRSPAQRLALASLILMAVSAGTNVPGLTERISATHQHLADYGLTHFYGIKLLWLFIPGLAIWAGWMPRVPPLYQPSLGWLLLIPLLNVVFPLVVLAAGLLGLLAFRKSYHLPSTELVIATMVTGLWFMGFYLFSGGLAAAGEFSQGNTAAEPGRSMLSSYLVWWLQVQNALGYWALIKAVPVLLLFLPDLKRAERIGLGVWVLLIGIDLFQPFPYASLGVAFGLMLGTVWMCWRLFRQSDFLGLLATLTLALAPVMVLARSLPDAHQFYFLPAVAAAGVLISYALILALSSERARYAVSLLVVLASLGSLTRTIFIQQHHNRLDVAFIEAWQTKHWPGTGGKGIYFTPDQPAGEAMPQAWPLPDLEWVAPGSMLTDASPYVADPRLVRADKRAFVEILPFRHYSRGLTTSYHANVTGFCVQNHIGLAYTPKGVALPKSVRHQVADSIVQPAFTIFQLKTGR